MIARRFTFSSGGDNCFEIHAIPSIDGNSESIAWRLVSTREGQLDQIHVCVADILKLMEWADSQPDIITDGTVQPMGMTMLRYLVHGDTVTVSDLGASITDTLDAFQDFIGNLKKGLMKGGVVVDNGRLALK